jgi:predicted dehydrogenase
MSDRKLRIVILGVGHLGKLHTRLIPQIDEVELAGIYDLNYEKASQVGAEFSCPVFNSLEQALDNSDAVIIASATTAHSELSVKAISAGKHLFVEKPLAESSAKAREIDHRAKTAGLKLQVGHIERFNPAYKSLAGYKLQPQFIEVHRLAAFDPRGTDVAVVQDLMIHDLDLILKIVASPVKEVYASGVEVISGGIDIANARLIFNSGCVANVTASRLSAKKMRKMRIFQPDGYFSLDFLDGYAEIFKLSDADESPNAFVLGAIDQGLHRRNIIYIKPEPPKINALLEEQRAFVHSILNDLPVPVSGDDAVKALELSEKILSCIAERKQ